MTDTFIFISTCNFEVFKENIEDILKKENMRSLFGALFDMYDNGERDHDLEEKIKYLLTRDPDSFMSFISIDYCSLENIKFVLDIVMPIKGWDIYDVMYVYINICFPLITDQIIRCMIQNYELDIHRKYKWKYESVNILEIAIAKYVSEKDDRIYNIITYLVENLKMDYFEALKNLQNSYFYYDRVPPPRLKEFFNKKEAERCNYMKKFLTTKY
jgi:hypothetical protein